MIQERMTEEWVRIPGFHGYSVSTSGLVCNRKGRVLVVRVNQYGVPYVGMMRRGRQEVRSLPLLVASTFVPQPGPKFNTPIHLDGDRTNCAADNLMWRPRWFASDYHHQFDERYANPINRPIRDAETGEEYPNSWAVARRNGLLEGDVVLSILNHTITWPTNQRFVISD